jgi:hypothetical protein
MYNTCLFIDPYHKKYCFYRPFENEKGGSITFYCSSLQTLINTMKDYEPLFKEPFIPKGAIPQDKNWGNFDPSRLEPLPEEKVNKIIKYLNSIELLKK